MTAVPAPPRPQLRAARAPLPARAGGRFSKYLVPEVLFGWGALSEAGHAARRLGARRPFVVTDAGLVEAGWWGELAEHLVRWPRRGRRASSSAAGDR